MSDIVNLPKGISTVGISRDENIDIESLNDSKLKIFKTIINGDWKSWTKDAPPEYQAFSKLTSGSGYVVVTDDDTDITINGKLLEPTNIQATVGINALAIPYVNKVLKTKYVGNLEVSIMKTIDTRWGSWTADTPFEYQGFVEVDNTKGYVVYVESVDIANNEMGFGYVESSFQWGSYVPYVNPNLVGFDNLIKFTYNTSDAIKPYVYYDYFADIKTNLEFLDTVITGLYDNDIGTFIFTDIPYTGFVGDETAVIDNISTFKSWGVNREPYPVPYDMFIKPGFDIIYLDKPILGEIDEDALFAFTDNPYTGFVGDETAVVDDLASFKSWGINREPHLVPYDMFIKPGFDIMYLDTVITGEIDEIAGYSSNSDVDFIFNDTTIVTNVDETAIPDSMRAFKSWGVNSEPYPAPYDYFIRFNFINDFKGPDTGVVDSDILINSSNFN